VWKDNADEQKKAAAIATNGTYIGRLTARF
jgi:hypothetical protein